MNTQKLKHKFYYDEVYNVRFLFILNVKNDAELERVLKKHPNSYKYWLKCKEEGNVSIAHCAAKNVQSLNQQFIIIKKDLGTPGKASEAEWIGTLAHECLHAMMAVFRDRRVGYDAEGAINEHYTYYLDMLMRVALQP